MSGSLPALRTLFRVDGTVTRRHYIVVGLLLALVKYCIDAVATYAWTGGTWSPLIYFDPSFESRMRGVDAFPTPLLVFLCLSTLPFLWIGVALSARRARDAGGSWWFGLMFLVPILNYAAILAFCSAPTAENATPSAPRDPFVEHSALLAALGAIAVVLLLTFGLTEGLGYYGPALFVGLPMLIGVVIGYLSNAKTQRSAQSTVMLGGGVILAGFAGLLAFGIEGLVCLAMAYPLAFVVSIPGSLLGRAVARLALVPDRALMAVTLLIPFGAWLEMRVVEHGEREVATSIEVDAPPSVVWQHVVSFSELPTPDHWLFRTGIAYPLRARIEGSGVGAVRYCEFSTGPFVEPITVWDEPRRLAFDVAEQPVPMEEWSFYAHMHPPHLDDAFRSVRGEFRLVALEGGRTRLEGSTWYRMKMGPSPYWKLWGDAIIHRIHGRVLRHVRSLSEG